MKLRWELTADANEIALPWVILGAESHMPIMAEEHSRAINPFSVKLPVAEVDCSAKKYCMDMSICDAAKDYLVQCGRRTQTGMATGCPVRPCLIDYFEK